MNDQALIVALTGAGISAESGLRTFRDSDGLWEGYNVEEVATPFAWQRDQKLVQDFYNQRRRDIQAAQPNKAHLLLAELEKHYRVQIVTQNIDDLHERAGSSSVLHLHGEIFKMRSDKKPHDDRFALDIRGDLAAQTPAEDGGYLRPHIVWFHESVPAILSAEALMESADIFILVGTSLAVYPAAGLIHSVPDTTPKYIIDKVIPKLGALQNVHTLEQTATEGMIAVAALLNAKK
ncbi:MAG: NAD-dependent deacylase [Bacteroidetes bacterium]|nr:NAD-dependent deacylase [Bacteroidota bacterium]